MEIFYSSSFSGLSRPNVVRPRASASHSNSLMLVPPEIEVTSSGFGRSMSGLMGGWSRQLRATATTSLLPFATGAAASPKTFQRTIPAASRFFHGAAAPNIDILRSLRSIIDSEPQVVFGVPIGSPFELLNKSTMRKGALTYHYKHNDEVVIVYMPPEIEKNDENSGNSKSSATEFSVCILKLQARTVLLFNTTALEGEIRIDSLGFGDLKCYDDPLDCRPVPFNFNHLDEDLQAAFYKYLAVRGITADWYVENNVLYFR